MLIYASCSTVYIHLPYTIRLYTYAISLTLPLKCAYILLYNYMRPILLCTILCIHIGGHFFWSECRQSLEEDVCTWHCKSCKRCKDWREWHCSGCNRCQYGENIPCKKCKPEQYEEYMRANPPV